jgi:hypothetical protein
LFEKGLKIKNLGGILEEYSCRWIYKLVPRFWNYPNGSLLSKGERNDLVHRQEMDDLEGLFRLTVWCDG